MVPRELFLRMAALALVAILLSAALSLQAFAVGEDFQDSGFPGGAGEELPDVSPDDAPPEPPEDAPEDLEGDAGEDSPDPSSEGISDGLAADVHFIRQSIELILYYLFPLGVALFLFVAFCRWFYCTFIGWVL